MSKIVKIKAKQKPKDNSIELYFISNITDLSRYDVLSKEFYSTLDMAIISYVTESYKNTDIDFGTVHYPKLHLIVNSNYNMEDINNHPIAVYTVTTNKSNTKFDGKCYSIIDYDNYSIKKKITTLNELISEHSINICILNKSVSNDDGTADKKITDNENNPITDMIHHDSSASTDKSLVPEIYNIKGTRYSSVGTEYINDFATVKGHIYDIIQSQYISIILNAALNVLIIQPENIYLLDIESISIKNPKFKKEDITRTIKSFIDAQNAFMESESVFIPFYVDTGSESSKKLINMLIEAGFQGIRSLYIYADEPNSNKVFEELLKMENSK